MTTEYRNESIPRKEIALQIMEALSEVDEELLVRCEETRKRIPMSSIRRFTAVAAACVCLLVVGVGGYSVWQFSGGNDNAVIDIQDLVEEMVADNSIPENADTTAGGAPSDESQAPVSEEEAPSEMKEQDTLEGTESVKEEGLESQTENENTNVQENQAAAAEESVLESIQGDRVDEELCSLPITQPLTEEQAYAMEPYGQYLPTALPNGYTYETGNIIEYPEGGTLLRVSWMNGMDYIDITVSSVQTTEVVTDPVFVRGDLSLALVEARMKVVEDGGDTDTPRGNLALLLGNNILVEFSGKGSAQEIYDMLQSIPE